MAFRPSVAVFDACVLYPFHLRNIVVQAAVNRLVEARWTDAIHDELVRNLAVRAPAIPLERLRTTRQLMTDALPTAMVNEYEHHISVVNPPDPNDRHVVAAGISSGASVVRTWNLRHFPARELRKFSLRGETPDGFLSRLYDEVPNLVIGSLANARRNLTRTRASTLNFIDILRNQQLVELAKRVQKRVADL